MEKKDTQEKTEARMVGSVWRGAGILGSGEAPCLGCARRALGCHDGCPDYIAHKERKDAKATAERRTAGWISGKR